MPQLKHLYSLFIKKKERETIGQSIKSIDRVLETKGPGQSIKNIESID